MKLRMRSRYASQYGNCDPGGVIDVPDHEAHQLIAGRFAEEFIPSSQQLKADAEALAAAKRAKADKVQVVSRASRTPMGAPVSQALPPEKSGTPDGNPVPMSGAKDGDGRTDATSSESAPGSQAPLTLPENLDDMNMRALQDFAAVHKIAIPDGARSKAAVRDVIRAAVEVK